MKARILFRCLILLGCGALSVPALAAEKAATPIAKTASNTDIERGRYLVAISGCNDCHTPGFMAQGSKVPEKDWLTGGTLGWRGSWGTT